MCLYEAPPVSPEFGRQRRPQSATTAKPATAAPIWVKNRIFDVPKSSYIRFRQAIVYEETKYPFV